MKVYKNGKFIQRPVVRYGADGKPAFVADQDGDRTWKPADQFTFEDLPAAPKTKGGSEGAK